MIDSVQTDNTADLDGAVRPLAASMAELADARTQLNAEALALSKRLIAEKKRIAHDQQVAFDLGQRPKRYPYAPLILSVEIEPYLRLRWHRMFRRAEARFSKYLPVNRTTHASHRSKLRKYATPEEIAFVEEIEDAARVIRRTSTNLAKATRALEVLAEDLSQVTQLTRPFG